MNDGRKAQSPPRQSVAGNGSVKSIDVASKGPSAVETAAHKSGDKHYRQQLAGKIVKEGGATVQAIGFTQQEVPESEYQPKPEAMASPGFSDRSRIKAMMIPPSRSTITHHRNNHSAAIQYDLPQRQPPLLRS